MTFCLIQMQQGHWRLNLVFLLAIMISFQQFSKEIWGCQWFCWRSTCFGLWHCVVGWVVPNISKDHSAFFLGFVDLDSTGTVLLHVSNYLPEKSQTTLIIINTTVRTLNLECNILFRGLFIRYSVVTLKFLIDTYNQMEYSTSTLIIAIILHYIRLKVGIQVHLVDMVYSDY